MVSSLWKVCSEGDLQKVLELLNESAVDIELKDHTGVTPLIEAVKNNRVDIVKVLLDRGANPMNPSSQGHLPEYHTSERAILDLLHPPQNETLPSGVLVYNSEGAGDVKEPFYTPPPPGAYSYFPTINTPISSGNEAGVYYPSSQPQPGGDIAVPNGLGNLPPPEIARMIPCRYFPACRYGTQCMFAHPQTPYYPTPISPLHYPPYDSNGNPFMHSYYQPPPPLQQPDGIHHLTPLSPPGPSVMHARSPSEVVSHTQGHFSPNGAPPLPYGPIASPVYSHPGQMPVPISMPPLPPLHHSIPHAQSPHNIYNASTSPVLPFVLHQDLSGPSAPPVAPSTLDYPDIAPSVKLPPEQTENYNIQPRETNRRGAGRRPSVGSRKPPCLFFPAGRCKNGNDCRFPHVLTDNAMMPTPPLPTTRGGGPRPRGQVNGHNGFPNVETKLGAMSIRDDAPRPKNAFEVTCRSQNEAGNRPRYPHGGKNQHNGNLNTSHLHKKATAPKQQRVPNPDEFPVLAGTVTPPSRPSGLNGVWVNGNGHAGPTAAQILQTSPTVRKEGNKEPIMHDTTPDSTRNPSPKDANAEVNGVPKENLKSIHEQAPVSHINTRPAMSFATATSGPADVSKEVSVSA